jgi:hypothetical protein
MKEATRFTLIEGGQRSFEAEVARLVEKPDGIAAMNELKRLARQRRPAANTVLEDVSANCKAAPHNVSDRPGFRE